MSDIHFTKNYQLEAIRAELQKVLGALSNLVAAPTPSPYLSTPLSVASGNLTPMSQAADKSLTNARVAAYQQEILEMQRSHKAEIAKMQDQYNVVEKARDHADALLVEARELGDTRRGNLQILTRKYDIALLKLRDVHALSGDSSLTSKPTPVEFP